MTEPRTPFIVKSLHQAVAKSFMEEISELVRREQAVYLNADNTMKFRHGRRWASPANDLGDKEGETEHHSVESSLALADVVKGDPAITFEHTAEIARAMISSFERMLFAKMNEVTAKMGNVVNAAEHNSQFGPVTELFRFFDLVFCHKGETSWHRNLPRNSAPKQCVLR